MNNDVIDPLALLYNTSFNLHKVTPLTTSGSLSLQANLKSHSSRLTNLLRGDVLRGVRVASETVEDSTSRTGNLKRVEFSAITIPGANGSLRSVAIVFLYEKITYSAFLIQNSNQDASQQVDQPIRRISTRRASSRGEQSNSYPLLLTRLPASLQSRFIEYLAENFDCHISSLRIPDRFIMDSIENHVDSFTPTDKPDEDVQPTRNLQIWLEPPFLSKSGDDVGFNKQGKLQTLKTIQMTFSRADLPGMVYKGNELKHKQGKEEIDNRGPFELAFSLYAYHHMGILVEKMRVSKAACGEFVIGTAADGSGRCKILTGPTENPAAGEQPAPEGRKHWSVLLARCLALPQVRQAPKSNSLPEPAQPNIPWGPGGLADFPEIVDETNLVNEPTQQAVQPVTGPAAVDNTLNQVAAIWDPFLDPEYNPPIVNTDPVGYIEPINLFLANILAGINPPAILNGPVADQDQVHVQQPQVFVSEEDDEEIDSPSINEIIDIDFSEEPSSTGLGYVEESLSSDTSQPFAYHPMVKREISPQGRNTEAEFQAVEEISQQDCSKSDPKVITPAQWESWYDALNDTALTPLYNNIHAATDLGLDLEQAAFQVARRTKGAIKPNSFLELAFYPMYDKIKGLALLSNVDELAKKLFDYQEPVRGMVEVHEGEIKDFIKDYTKASHDFTAVAANIAGGARKSDATTNSEASSFENWVKDPKNKPQGLVELIQNLSTAIQAIFSAFSTLHSNYGFLGAEYRDVVFDQVSTDFDEDIVVENPSPPVKASIRFDATSGLDPDGDMFKSRELPKVLPPGRWASAQAA
ncbi:hypothetical protein AOL_s00210g174 [Orbilia oligospora ATCC 24927]|uniref:Uncharacterized protein n=1 Tax=Arthrobotrys oligospora (strain ATCC 24927 / CBS 115.81 / DSM 1491) TaxID=756982 RepID=G1XS16_ARTOA|nr:hypothetical protein AOL_s00210g174 [Orbilia oligospora ATCC 24927]EGX44013.1 hypothetical protein AOL_s00210g174 [Orbilia oligospora ATCC 24927]